MKMKDLALKAKIAARKLALLSTGQKNAALNEIAKALQANKDKILEANSLDVKSAEKEKIAASLVDRLTLNAKRIEGITASLHEVILLSDPVGKILDEWERPNRLKLKKVSVPFGAVAIIYEARPNVTVDSVALCLKSGNSVILRGSSSTINTNNVLVGIMQEAISRAGVPRDSIQLVEDTSRNAMKELLSLNGLIDLAIPRGGKSLIEFVRENSRVPVIETGTGICHIYVDETADLEMAERIVVNAKCSRPSVCNAAEKLLVHKRIAKEFLPIIAAKFEELGVEIRADNESAAILGKFKLSNLKAATQQDFQTEFLDLIMASVVVEDVDEAIEHINKFGSHHSDAIISEDRANVEKFSKEVDSAVVYHNASTRFSDGGEFGFGMEIGISTQKLHARGPFGLEALTSYKYLVGGSGQIRVEVKK